MAMKPIVKMAAQNAAANSARASDVKKLALQKNGTFSPAVKPNMPMMGPIGGKNMPPPRTGGMIATPPPGMGGRLGAVGGAPAMGGSQMGGQLGAPSGMPAGMLGSGGPKINPYTLPPANAQAAYSAPPPQANFTSMVNKLPMASPSAGMKKGGSVKASKMGAVKQSKPSMGSASKRGDGIAQRGKTKGRIV
jgi:hypothetical protein